MTMSPDAYKAMTILQGYRHLLARNEEIRERKARLLARATGTSYIAGGGGFYGFNSSKPERAAVQLPELEQQLEDMEHRTFEERHMIQAAIDRMDCEIYKRLLELRYIDGKLWTPINQKLHISRSCSQRYHIAALESFYCCYMAQKLGHSGTFDTVK